MKIYKRIETRYNMLHYMKNVTLYVPMLKLTVSFCIDTVNNPEDAYTVMHLERNHDKDDWFLIESVLDNDSTCKCSIVNNDKLLTIFNRLRKNKSIRYIELNKDDECIFQL